MLDILKLTYIIVK